VTRVVIDASAGAEIVTATVRGRALARLLPGYAELWVPEHFYVEVLGVLRHQSVITSTINPTRAEQLDASFLTDDHRLAGSPTFPGTVPVIRLPMT
jgi:predicted nucleic acid-binding protein